MTIQRPLALLALGVFVITMLSACASPVSPSDGSAYLSSLKNSHRMDAKAKKLCLKGIGTPISKSTPVTKPIIAVDSTLSQVRKIEAPGYAVKAHDDLLIGHKQGYAAICLIQTTNYGRPAQIWAFYVPGGDSDAIIPGGASKSS